MTTNEFRARWEQLVRDYRRLKKPVNAFQNEELAEVKRSLLVLSDQWKEMDAMRRKGELVDTDRVEPIASEVATQVKLLGVPCVVRTAEFFIHASLATARWGVFVTLNSTASITNKQWEKIWMKLDESIEMYDYIDFDLSVPGVVLNDQVVESVESGVWPDAAGRVPYMAWAIFVNDWKPDFSEVKF